jgi:hypothetical protein
LNRRRLRAAAAKKTRKTVMPKNTKKSERDALLKERRKVRRGNAAQKAAKRPVKRANVGTHPHRRTAALRARKRA